jgi:ABC-type oligopeptide transport system substrate-binding subunit
MIKKMKNKINFITLILSIAILFVACGGNDSPRSVGEKFLKAMSSQDFETAKKYGTEETEKLLDMMSGFTKMSNDSVAKEMKFEITREKVTGDNATVFYKEDGREGELQLPMVKVDGKWKVLLSKESINSSDASMDIGATNTDTMITH